MAKPFAFSVWLGAIVYAVIGIFGVLAFHGIGPTALALSDGYGVPYTVAAAAPGNGVLAAK